MPLIPDAFTVEFRSPVTSITTNIGVTKPFELDDRIGQAPKPYMTAALWDTGASHCLITKSLAENLELLPINKVLVQHAKGASYENLYFATLFITKKYYIDIELTECQSISNNFEVIIGLDIISQGDFAITNQGKKTTFSFRLPSTEKIDFSR